MSHKFEIFSAGCDLCKKAIETLRNNVCDKCEIVEYGLQNPIQEEVQEKIKKYDISVVPTIIVDEEHKYIGNLKSDEIKKIIADI
ncbi:MAG: thioredoxin family protein [Candidatus Lokiarchaeota archaeon]|nr:thioredoxin family protein [Candidatus Lokiarchaeota archaeon]